MSIFLYSHGGSGNHGCEAIVRGTKQIFCNELLTLYSNDKNQDQKYGVDQIVELQNSRKNHKRTNIKRLLAALQIRFFNKEDYATKISVEHMVKRYKKGDIGLSIGGDNYCYPGFEEFGIINGIIRKRGIITVLWGCSVEPCMINRVMAEDLLAYDLIIARESITFQALNELGAKVILSPDPAFQLQPKVCQVPFKVKKGKVIGVNISPHIIKCETENGMAYQNYVELIRYILENTDYQIALIPHVVWNTNDDREINNKLYTDFEHNERIIIVQDHGCEELKYIISQCSMFIGARTHATIAAYSSCVPTLVVGYSVKARGIAKDIFGTEKNYVLSVQNLNEKNDLVKAFRWLAEREYEIRTYLEEFIPGYIEQGKKVKDSVIKLSLMRKEK